MCNKNGILNLMQSYGDYPLIPKICANSSPTCMDKRPIFGQIDKNPSKIVQNDEKRPVASLMSSQIVMRYATPCSVKA